MNKPATPRPPILVGQRVRVARPVGGGPINREGHTGKVVDVLNDGTAYLVRFHADREDWVPAGNVALASEVAPRATVAEPEGHDDHLDAIERRVTERIRIEGGRMLVTERVAFVPKGGE